MSDWAIAIDNLAYTYPGAKAPVLSIKSLTIPRGQHVFLEGPSGSGKTTLLGILTGILPDYEGSVQVLQQEVRALKGTDRDKFRGENIGYIFQLFNLIPYLSVEENILLPCRLVSSRNHGQTLQEDLRIVCEQLEIGALLRKDVRSLSVGQQQRVAAARAFLGRPPIIIADEPTSALDKPLRTKFIELLLKQATQHQQTVFFVSHDDALKDQFHTSLSLPQINEVNRG